jgi:hypothetical protein
MKVALRADGRPRYPRPDIPWIRRQAGIIYCTHAVGLTITELHRTDEFCHLSRATLVDWCREDKWVERREEVYRSWNEQIQKAMSSELVTARVNEFRQLEDIRQQGIAMLKSKLIEAKSFEGLLTALLRCGERIDDLRKLIGQEVQPGAKDEVKNDLTDAQIDAAVKAALEALRATGTE